ncbi:MULTISPECIES: hypothetical protein [Vibrio]|uniref:hypothetical protein n=1 Tax=Vibrio TaxID=662 RepID=UPI00104AC898|nr:MULTISPECIES: hypothetical protein [Vibrio]
MENVINLKLAMEGELASSGQWTLDTTDEQLNELIRERIRQGSLQRECIDEVIFTTEESVPLSTETYSRLDEFFWNQLEIALRLQEPED